MGDRYRAGLGMTRSRRLVAFKLYDVALWLEEGRGWRDIKHGYRPTSYAAGYQDGFNAAYLVGPDHAPLTVTVQGFRRYLAILVRKWALRLQYGRDRRDLPNIYRYRNYWTGYSDGWYAAHLAGRDPEQYPATAQAP